MKKYDCAKILIVCMGNICRSPTGEAVLRKLALNTKLNIIVDSAGTIAYHQGNPPDKRSRASGERRGYDFGNMRARQINSKDFADFDLILAADKANLTDLSAMCPAQYQHKLKLFLSYGDSRYDEIPDPYYGEGDGFEVVLDLIENAAQHIMADLDQ
ncbi:low molecular weight protein-tyrosine-phosphatase [Pseudoalteromonas aurantia]|uniref:protein-tyrosine-phosphatase n=1 Tax=Pseudoalteromonas aurantia 208 TaxID=1314867 RepID=A0ABR9EIQ9_9GAMM|nr:low molecular weight protein-tyrosine-phosphatase [Pseudoalteromonas aurantia]MBE0370888.1 protein-tyrosine phosphatase [Pseudoalteromonas aurantia 208]